VVQVPLKGLLKGLRLVLTRMILESGVRLIHNRVSCFPDGPDPMKSALAYPLHSLQSAQRMYISLGR
jgi:hypothetical protein